MTDTSSLSILPVVTANDVTANLVTPVAQNSVTDGSAGGKPPNEGSFLDFLEAFNAMPAAEKVAQGEALGGGSTLPPVTETAEIDRLPLTSLPYVSVLSPSAETGKQAGGGSAVESILPSQAASAALASRLVGLAQARQSANPAVAALNNSASHVHNEQPLASALVAATGDDLPPVMLAQAASSASNAATTAAGSAVAAPLALSNPSQLSALNAQGSKNPTNKLAATAVAQSGSTPAVDGHNELTSSSLPPVTEAAEMDALLAQAKKSFVEQHAATLTQTPAPANATLANPVAASALNAPTILTTEAGSTTTHQATLPETFGKPEWNQGLAKQMLWMSNQNIRSAELRLNPANLGPIEVRIDMDDDKVSLAFSSRHAGVREAVELAMPRLREMFEESGLKLADTDISQQSFAEQRSQQAAEYSNRDKSAPGHHADTVNSAVSLAEEDAQAVNLGLVDYYI